MMGIPNASTHLASTIRHTLASKIPSAVYTDTIPEGGLAGDEEVVILIESEELGDINFGGELLGKKVETLITLYTAKKSTGRTIKDLIVTELHTYGYELKLYTQRLDEDKSEDGSSLELTLINMTNRHFNGINYKKGEGE